MIRFVRTVTLASACLLASSLHAEDKPYAVGLDVDPIITLLSAVPGVTAIGAGAEIALAPKLSLTCGYDQVDIALSEKQLAKTKEKQDADDPLLRDAHVQAIAPGLRLYFNGAGDSIYAGGFAALTTSAATVDDGGETYELRGTSVDPGAELGYRWRWSSGFVVRLGGRYSQPTAEKAEMKRRSTGEVLTQAEADAVLSKGEKDKETKSGHPQGSAGVDLRLGVVF